MWMECLHGRMPEHERNGMYEYANKIDTSGHVP